MGMAVRVPTPNVSCVDLVATLKKTASAEEINAAMKEASEGPLKGILGYTDEPIVSSDVMTLPFSSLFDSEITTTIGPSLVKILSWYDNEWGYSNRMVDTLKHVHSVING